jgi:hypothetical protein
VSWLCSFRNGSLTRLATDVLAEVPDTFAFVGLGRTERAEVRCDLADKLFVDAAEDEMFLFFSSCATSIPAGMANVTGCE